MVTQLRWLPARMASALHAAQQLVAGRPLVEPLLAQALQGEVEHLQVLLTGAGIPLDLFLLHAIPLGTGQLSLREWADRSLQKAAGRQAADRWHSEVQEVLRGLVAVMDRQYPQLAHELELRAGPLREQWEARGPGLLTVLARQTDPQLLPPQADVLLVHPVCGGGGRAHLLYNSVRFEALLTHPYASLPETLRLAWLVGQLQLDLPEFQGRLDRNRLLELAELALVPAVLSAAEEVELAGCQSDVVALALTAWQVLPPGASSEDARTTAACLLDWWGTYCDARPAFSLALAALDQMLLPANGGSGAS